MQSVTLLIKEADVGLFYELAAKYHAEGSTFLRAALNEQKPKSNPFTGPIFGALKEKPDRPPDLYPLILEKCSCRTCYSALARADRIPWTLTKESGKVCFTNPKHGIYVIPSRCEIAKNYQTHRGARGWVFEAQPLKAQIVTSKIKLNETKAAVEAEKLEHAKNDQKRKDERHKQQQVPKLTKKEQKQQAERDKVAAKQADKSSGMKELSDLIAYNRMRFRIDKDYCWRDPDESVTWTPWRDYNSGDWKFIISLTGYDGQFSSKNGEPVDIRFEKDHVKTVSVLEKLLWKIQGGKS